MPPSDRKNRIFIGPEPGNTIKLAIIGMPNTGKSSLFNALVAPPLHKMQPVSDFCFTTLGISRGEFPIEDKRLDWYQKIFGAKRAIGFTSIVADGPALVRGSHAGNGEGMQFMEQYRDCDVYLHVLRGWDDAQLTHWEETVNPVRDAEIVTQELLMADLVKLENRILELYKEHDSLVYNHQPVGKNHKWEKWTLLRAWHWIVGRDRTEHPFKANVRKHDPMPDKCEGWALRLGEWDDMEIEILQKYKFFTAKPVVYVLNIPVREHTRLRAEWLEKIKVALTKIELGANTGYGYIVPMSLALENRLAQKRREGLLTHYLEANPSHLSLIPDLNMLIARSLDLITFYTGKTPLSTPGFIEFVPEPNDNDVCAWRCRQGKNAQDAAALINTEVSRYYNRLTMYSESDLRDENGDFDKLIEFGKNRMQQKKYEMNDGDIVEFFAFDVPPDVVEKPPTKKR